MGDEGEGVEFVSVDVAEAEGGGGCVAGSEGGREGGGVVVVWVFGAAD